jgi:cytochrome c
MIRRLAFALCLTALCAGAPAAAQSGNVERGRVFATAHCARCHAVTRVGASPIAIAPPLRTLHERYRIDDLAEAFAEGISTGHPTMPEFRLEPDQIEDLIAFLNAIQTRP